jgi:lipoprotein Spr
MRFNYGFCCILTVYFLSCNGPGKPTYVIVGNEDSLKNTRDTSLPPITPQGSEPVTISTGNTTPAEIVSFAASLTGIPYKYGSIDPRQGFDCSGFITYVFNHFNIAVPRRSIDFTFVNYEIDLSQAKAGDLVLFTGTDSTLREVGHMGIVVSPAGEDVRFIHSTSGKDNGVTEASIKPYYIGRYMKTIRIFH